MEHLYKESVKAAAPKVETAADKVSPAIDTAHDKIVDDFLPKLVAAMNEAAVKAGAAVEKAADVAADKGKGSAKSLAAAAAEASGKKKHTGAKVFWLLATLIGLGAAAAAWTRSRSSVDPWAEPWEPTDAGTTHARVADAADAVGEAAGSAVAKGRDATRKAAEKVSAATESLTEKVSEAKDDLTEKVAGATDAAKKATRRTTKPADGTAVVDPDAGPVAEPVTEPVTDAGPVAEPVTDADQGDRPL